MQLRDENEEQMKSAVQAENKDRNNMEAGDGKRNPKETAGRNKRTEPSGRTDIRKIAQLSMILGFALMLSYVETLIPVVIALPGAKLGLPNLAVLLVLYLYGWKEAAAVNVMRIFLSGFLFGNFYGILYSLAGAVFSFGAMCVGKRFMRLQMWGVSILGGIFHNIGQMTIAAWVAETEAVWYYLPFLLLTGCLTGTFLGAAAQKVMDFLPKRRR